MDDDKSAIRRFIERVHGPEPFGWLVLWTRQNKLTKAFNLAEESVSDRIVDYVTEMAAAQDTYAAVGLQGQEPTNGSRGKEDGVVSLPGVWADIDIAGPAHKNHDLPPGEQQALSLIHGVGFPPTIVVKTGHGFQPYWLFKEPFVIETEAEHEDLKSLSRRFQQLVRQLAQARGWTLDPTADLCRPLRIPGTFNRKIAGEVQSVTAEYLDRAYSLDDIRELVNGVDDNPERRFRKGRRPELPPANLLPILDGCAWIQHCRDDVSSLPEPEWYQMLTVVARCQDAECWAHELSRAYPKYSQRETQRKLKQASSDRVAPVTCAYVESDLNGGRFCSHCLFRGNVNSPIAIGRIEGVVPSPRSTEMICHCRACRRHL